MLKKLIMWRPFANKTKEIFPSEWELTEARVHALRQWRDVGQEFEYLGRRMVVIKHSRIDMWPGLHFPELHLVPEIHARYADDRGEVHTLVMSELEALALATHSVPPNAGIKAAGR